MAAVAIAAVVVGTVVQTVGAIKKSRAVANQANRNADIADENKQIIFAEGAEIQRQQRVIARKQLGNIRTSFAASGVDITGSALDVLEESAAQAELDALLIGFQTERKARGFEIDAETERRLARNAKSQGNLQAAGILLGGGAKIAGFGK